MPGFISGLDLDGNGAKTIKDPNQYWNLICSTGRNVAAKTVTAANFSLINNMKVAITFSDTGNSNPESGDITLNINGTGAKTVKDVDGITLTYSDGMEFCGNKLKLFMYDGTYWILLNKTTSGGGSIGINTPDPDNVMLVTFD